MTSVEVNDHDTSESDSDDIPDTATCQKLTEEFAEITDTDQACAHFFLQDHSWDLQKSVNAYFESTKQSGSKSSRNEGSRKEISCTVDKSVLEAFGLDESAKVTNVPPPKFLFFTWNIDGLSQRNLKLRTKAVCKIIFMEKPDIVFLQEVIPDTLEYIKEKLPEYRIFPGNDTEYFTATMCRVFTVYPDSDKIIDFPTTRMGRNLLVVEAHIGKLKLTLMNTHLESCSEHSSERISQLKKCFDVMNECAEDRTVIFAGDLNLRDRELEQAGGIPPGIEDLWQTCGSRKECQYTWDMIRNSNNDYPGKFKPRCRFDRAYIRHSHPQRAHPAFFGLVGIEKVNLTQTFPSDHWGLRVYFDISHD